MFIDTREVVSHFIPTYAKGKTLDIGGGTSKYRDIIRQTVSEYLVSDLHATTNVDFVEDARALTHEDATFDTVLSFQVLEHIDDTAKVVAEMYRVLKKGGHAIATMPFLYPQHGDPSDFHRFTKEAARFHFERAGFTTIELGAQGSIWSVIANLVRHKYLDHYDPSHSKARKMLFRRIFSFLAYLDRRGYGYHPDIYSNVYIVARK